MSNTSRIGSGAPPAPPRGGGEGEWHLIARGDTLWGLARRFRVPLGKLIAANPQIENPNLIYAGRYLWVPKAPVAEAGKETQVKADRDSRDVQHDPKRGKTTGQSTIKDATTNLQSALTPPETNAGVSTRQTSAKTEANEQAQELDAPAETASTETEPAETAATETEASQAADQSSAEAGEEADSSVAVSNGEGFTARFLATGWKVAQFVRGGDGTLELTQKGGMLFGRPASEATETSPAVDRTPWLGAASGSLRARIYLPEDDKVRLDQQRSATTRALQKDGGFVFWGETEGDVRIATSYESVWGKGKGSTEIGAPGHFNLKYNLLVPYNTALSDEKLSAAKMLATQTIDLPVTAEKARKLLPGSRFTITHDAGLSLSAEHSVATLDLLAGHEGSVGVERLDKDMVRVSFTREEEYEAGVEQQETAGDAFADPTTADGEAEAEAESKSLKLLPKLKRSGTTSRTESYLLDLSQPEARAAYNRLIGGSPTRARELIQVASSGVTRDSDESASRSTTHELGLDGEQGDVSFGLDLERARDFSTSIRATDDNKVEVRVSRSHSTDFSPNAEVLGGDGESSSANLDISRELSIVEVYELDLGKPHVKEALAAVRRGDLDPLRALVRQNAEGVLYTPESRDRSTSVELGGTIDETSFSLTITNEADETASIELEDESTATITITQSRERGLSPDVSQELSDDVSVRVDAARGRSSGQHETYTLDLQRPPIKEAYLAARRGDFSELRALREEKAEGLEYAWQRRSHGRDASFSSSLRSDGEKRSKSVSTSRRRSREIEATPIVDGKYQVTVRQTRGAETSIEGSDLLYEEKVSDATWGTKKNRAKATLAITPKKGKDSTVTYVFDPSQPQAALAFEEALSGRLRRAQALARTADSGVTVAEQNDERFWGNRLGSTVEVAFKSGVSAGVELYSERVADNDGRITGSDVRSELTRKELEEKKPIAWYASGGVLNAGLERDVKMGPISPGFSLQGTLEYHCLVPSHHTKAPLAKPRLLPLTWQRALAYPAGSEVIVRGKGTARAAISHSWLSIAGSGGSAGVSASAEKTQDLSLTFHRLGESMVRLILADGQESSGGLALEASLRAFASENGFEEDEISKLTHGMLSSTRTRPKQSLESRLKELLQVRAGMSSKHANATQKAVSFDFDLATPEGRAGFAHMMKLDVKAVEEAVARGEMGITAVGKYRDFDKTRTAESSVTVASLPITSQKTERRQRVATLLTPESQKDFVVHELTKNKSGLLKSGSVRWATVCVRDPSEKKQEWFLHLQLDDLRDRWTSGRELDRFRSFVQLMGAEEKSSVVKKDKLKFFDRLDPAVHGQTTTNADIYFTEAAVQQMSCASREQALLAYAKARQALHGEKELPAWAGAEPARRAWARTCIKHYWETGATPDGEIAQRYTEITGREISTDAARYALAEHFAAFVAKLRGAGEVVFTDVLDASSKQAKTQKERSREFLNAFTELGRKHGFDFYATMAAMNALAGEEVVLLQQLEIIGVDPRRVSVSVEPEEGRSEPYVYVRQAFTPTSMVQSSGIAAEPYFSIGSPRWSYPRVLAATGNDLESVVGNAGDESFELATRLAAVCRYGQALETLRKPGIDANDPRVVLLTARCHYMKGDYEKAAKMLDTLVRQNKASGEALLWLGYTCMRLAERSGPDMTAARVATLLDKALAYVERARQTLPFETEPVHALFELYLSLPAALGGGYEKAREVALALRDKSPIESRLLLTRYYERRAAEAPDAASQQALLNSAEQELKAAANSDPADIGASLELVHFLSRHARMQESLELFTLIKARSRNVTRLLFEEAQLYVQAGRNLKQAESLLSDYLRHELSPEDPPATVAQELLTKVRTLLSASEGATP